MQYVHIIVCYFIPEMIMSHYISTGLINVGLATQINKTYFLGIH